MARSNRAKKRLQLLVVVLAAGAVVVGGSYVGIRMYRAQRLKAARAEGWRLFDAGDYAGALTHLSAYVGPNQSDVDAVLRLARAREEVEVVNGKHLVDAISFYRAVRALRPDDTTALEGLVRCYAKLGYGLELERTGDELLRVDPKNIVALEATMSHYHRRGVSDEALQRAEKLVAIEPRSYRWRVMVLEIMRAGGASVEDREAKIRKWEAAAASEGVPADGRYQLFLADVFYGGRKLEEAKDAARNAADRGMPDTEMLGVLIGVLDVLDMSDEAAKAVAAAAKSGVDPTALAIMMARRYFLDGYLSEAAAELDAVQSPTEARRAEHLRWKAIVAEATRDYDRSNRALDQLIEATTSDPASADRWAKWAAAVRATRDVPTDAEGLRSSIEALDAALAANLGDTFLILRSGELAARLGDYEQAARRYRTAFDAESRRWAVAGVHAATALVRCDRTDEAFRLARELIARFGERSPLPYIVLADVCVALAREGRLPSSIDPSLPANTTGAQLLERIYESALPNEPSLLPALVTAELVDGNEEKATAYTSKAVSDAATPGETLLLLAAILSDSRFGALPEQAIAAAAARGASAPACAVARSRVRLARGDAAGARGEVESLLTGPDAATLSPQDRVQLTRARAEAAIGAGSPDALALLGECLKVGGDAETASFVLTQPLTWSDEGWVIAAIDRLRSATGARSPRVVLHDADRVLRFHRGDQKQISAALQAVNELLNADPDSADVLVSMSRLLAATAKPDLTQASKYLAQAVTLQPGRRELYPELISLLQSAGDFAGARSLLQRYERLAQDDPEGARLATQLMMAQGEYRSALPALERLARKTGAEADAVALAETKRRLGQTEEAERILTEACAREDRTLLALFALADLYARADRLAEARALIDADSKRPTPTLTPANAAYIRARLELDFGDPAAAAPLVAAALERAPDAPSVHFLAARQKLATGDAPGAMATARAALERWPDDPSLLGLVSSLLLSDRGSREASASALAALKDRNPALFELITVVRQCERPDGSLVPTPESLRAAAAVTERYPRFLPGWMAAIELHAAGGQPDQAIRIAKRAMARLPGEAGPAELAARLLLAERRFDEAREAATAWRTLAADAPIDADITLARIAFLSGEPGRAVSILSPHAARLASEVDRRPEALAMPGVAQLFDGNAESGVATLRAAMTTSGPVLSEWLRGVRSLPTPAAMDALARTEAVVATTDNGRLSLVAEYVAIGRRSDAAAALARAEALLGAVSAEVRSEPVARLLVADLAAATGKPLDAMKGYDEVMASVPEDVRSRVASWETLDAAAREELAGPRSMLLYAGNNKASTLADAGVELDAALAAVDQALRADPESSSLLDTKALVLLARREFDPAREAATAARDRAEDKTASLVTLARIELAAGRPDEARRHLAAAERELAVDLFLDRTLLDRVAEVKAALDRVATERSS